MQGGTAKATAAADRRIAVAVAFDSLQMSIRAPLPPLPQPPKGIGTFKSWALDIYVCKCYIFFIFFLPPSSSVASSVRAASARAREPSRRNDTGIDSFSPVYGTPGCCVMCTCGLQIAVWIHGGGWSWSSVRGRRKEKITPEPSSGMNATAYDIIYFTARRKPKAVVPPPLRTTRQIPIVEHVIIIYRVER